MDEVKHQRDDLQNQLQQHQFEREKLSQEIDLLVIKAREQRAQDELHFQDLMSQKKKVDLENLEKQQIINDKD